MKTVNFLLATVAAISFSTVGFGQTYNIPSASGTSSTYLGTATGDLNLNSTSGNVYLKTAGTVTNPSIAINTEGNVGIGILPNTQPPSGYFMYAPALQIRGVSGLNAVPFLSPRSILNLTSSTPGCNGAYQFGIQTNNRPFIYSGTGPLDLIVDNLNISGISPTLTVGSAGDVIASGSTATSKLMGSLKVGGTMTIGGTVVLGNVTIPANNPYGLYVQYGILTEKVRVAVYGTSNWADYVFDKNYKLLSLGEVETYINKNKHLPDVPSAEEVVKDGIDMATMDAKLLQKIEELTLYMIAQQKQLDEMKKEIQNLKK